MQLSEVPFVDRVLECRHPDLLHHVHLVAADRVGAIDEAVEWPITDTFLELLVSFFACQLIHRPNIDRLGRHCYGLKGAKWLE